jgi:hypothetical protein
MPPTAGAVARGARRSRFMRGWAMKLALTAVARREVRMMDCILKV